jgi:hypothetical protein
MFDYVLANAGTQGYDKGFNMHSAKIGLRYQFGGGAYASGGYTDGPVYK